MIEAQYFSKSNELY